MRTRLVSSSIFLLSSQAFALGHWFNGRDVDVWNEGKMVEESSTNFLEEEKNEVDEKLPVTESIIRSADFLPFSWKDYENPMSPQFWDDGGNYVPPRPMRVLAAHPTTENLQRYLAWQNRKMDLTTRLTHLISNTESSRSGPVSVGENVKGNASGNRQFPSALEKAARINWKKVEVVFAYKSSCPFCRKEVPVIELMKKKGASISALQINGSNEKSIIENSKLISDLDVVKMGIAVTPSLLIRANGKEKKLTGFVPFEEMEGEIAKLF